MSNNRAYIYLISFDNTNDIYIGKTTKNITKRFYEHIYQKGVIHHYMKKYNSINLHIDIIDSLDMNEVIYDKNFNIVSNTYRLDLLERFHINSYIEEKKYNLINIQRYSFYFHDYQMYILKKGFKK